MDEGRPIAYAVLEKGVPVLDSGGVLVGTVASVLAEPAEDVFHGLLVNTPAQGVRFVEAGAVSSLHEHGVDLRLDSAAAHNLPLPEHGAPVYDEDLGEMKGWHHWVHKATMRGDWHRRS